MPRGLIALLTKTGKKIKRVCTKKKIAHQNTEAHFDTLVTGMAHKCARAPIFLTLDRNQLFMGVCRKND